ncbi:MAG: hypothetical protein AUJ21_07705 [Anaerolineae bacterium CG1_02_58_13]|nr:MAG: hypothetical protein AUJ21_07705 [Anaerolineae bacterium CG1_02_58_13]
MNAAMPMMINNNAALEYTVVIKSCITQAVSGGIGPKPLPTNSPRERRLIKGRERQPSQIAVTRLMPASRKCRVSPVSRAERIKITPNSTLIAVGSQVIDAKTHSRACTEASMEMASNTTKRETIIMIGMTRRNLSANFNSG